MTRDDRLRSILRAVRGPMGVAIDVALTAIKKEYEGEIEDLKDLLLTRDEYIKELKSESEVERLRKFADYVLESEAWGNIDGGDIQDKAVELGLVELRPVDNENEYGADELYFTKWTPTISTKG